MGQSSVLLHPLTTPSPPRRALTQPPSSLADASSQRTDRVGGDLLGCSCELPSHPGQALASTQPRRGGKRRALPGSHAGQSGAVRAEAGGGHEHASGDALVLRDIFSSAGSPRGSLAPGAVNPAAWEEVIRAMTRAVAEQPAHGVFYPQVRQDEGGGSPRLHQQACFSELLQASPWSSPGQISRGAQRSALCAQQSRMAGAPPGESGRAWGRGLVPASYGRGLVPASCGRGLVPAQRRGRWPEARSAAPRELYIFLGEQDLWLMTKLHVTGPEWLGDSKFYSYYLYRWVGGWVGGVLSKYLQNREKNSY